MKDGINRWNSLWAELCKLSQNLFHSHPFFHHPSLCLDMLYCLKTVSKNKGEKNLNRFIFFGSAFFHIILLLRSTTFSFFQQLFEIKRKCIVIYLLIFRIWACFLNKKLRIISKISIFFLLINIYKNIKQENFPCKFTVVFEKKKSQGT